MTAKQINPTQQNIFIWWNDERSAHKLGMLGYVRFGCPSTEQYTKRLWPNMIKNEESDI